MNREEYNLDQKRLYKVSEVAKILNVHRTTVNKWIKGVGLELLE